MLGRTKKSPKVLGIHVGHNALTMANVLLKDDVVEVLELFRHSFSREPGGWPAEEVSVLLRKARKKINLKSEVTRLTVSSDLAPSNYFIMPPLDESQLDNAVRLKLENKLGDSAGEICHQAVISERHGERCRVFACSISAQKQRLILDSFMDSNCPVDAMEVEGVSVTNLMVRAGLDQTYPVAVMQIAPEWSEMYIVARKKLTLSRPILKLGTSHLTADEDEEPEQADGPSERYLDRIVREANKTLDYFEIELLSPAVRRLFLLGESADRSELTDFLARRLELEVNVLDTNDAIEDHTGKFEPTVHGLAVAAAAGGLTYAD